MTVTVIGVKPRDLRGLDRLNHVFSDLSPDRIVSEHSQRAHKRRLEQREFLKENGGRMAEVLVATSDRDVDEDTVRGLLDGYGYASQAVQDASEDVNVVFAGDDDRSDEDFLEALEEQLVRRLFHGPYDTSLSPEQFQAAVDDAYGEPGVCDGVDVDVLRDEDEGHAEVLETYGSSRSEDVLGVFAHDRVFGGYDGCLGDRVDRASIVSLGDIS